MLSQKEEQDGAVKLVKEYRTGMMDISRPVALYEKLNQGGKLLQQMKKVMRKPIVHEQV